MTSATILRCRGYEFTVLMPSHDKRTHRHASNNSSTACENKSTILLSYDTDCTENNASNSSLPHFVFRALTNLQQESRLKINVSNDFSLTFKMGHRSRVVMNYYVTPCSAAILCLDLQWRQRKVSCCNVTICALPRVPQSLPVCVITCNLTSGDVRNRYTLFQILLTSVRDVLLHTRVLTRVRRVNLWCSQGDFMHICVFMVSACAAAAASQPVPYYEKLKVACTVTMLTVGPLLQYQTLI